MKELINIIITKSRLGELNINVNTKSSYEKKRSRW